MSTIRASRGALRLSRQISKPNAQSISLPPRLTARGVATHCTPNQANAISVLPTIVDPSSEEYKENARQMGEVMERLEELTKKIRQGGPLKAREKHIARKKMLPRDRVTALIDPGTSFLELSTLAGYEVYPEAEVPVSLSRYMFRWNRRSITMTSRNCSTMELVGRYYTDLTIGWRNYYWRWSDRRRNMHYCGKRLDREGRYLLPHHR